MKINLSKFFQMRLNVLIFQALPPRVCFLYMRILGALYFFVKKGEKRLIEANIRDMLGRHHGRELRRLTRDTFRGIITHYFEKVFAAFRPYHYVKTYVEKHFHVRGIEVLDKALARGRGALLVTAHWGAVEFIPWVLAIKGYPMSVILECSTQFLLDALKEKIQYGDVELISAKMDGRVLFEALDSLKRNRLLMTEIDEVDRWHKREKSTIELFGKQLYFDNTLDVIARRTGAPVVGVFLERKEKHSYTLNLEDISVEKSPQSVARDALNLWQKYVARRPEQWYQWKKWSAMKAVS